MPKSKTILLIVLIGLLLGQAGSAGATPGDQALLRRYPVIPGIRGGVATQVRYLVRVGKQQGNRLDVFSKVGDSITAWGTFLVPVGSGGLRLEQYGALQGTVNFFGQTMARTNNAFANESLAAWGGWSSGDLLDPARAIPGGCGAGETPLDCELRLTRPAVALIMIGTNDIPGGNVEAFRANLIRIVSIVKRHGVIPVVSTLPYRMNSQATMDLTDTFNVAIVQVATAQAVPLWNYWLAMEALPNHGVSGDGVHPSQPPDGNTAIFDDGHLQYGFNMRNLTALQVLSVLQPYLR
jgi:hypothetical protein